LLPDDRVGSLPHRGLAGPQGVLRDLLAACIMQGPNTVDASSLHARSKALKAWITGLLAACITQCKVCGLHLAAELCMQEVLAVFAVCIFLRSSTDTGDDLQRAASLAT